VLNTEQLFISISESYNNNDLDEETSKSGIIYLNVSSEYTSVPTVNHRLQLYM